MKNKLALSLLIFLIAGISLPTFIPAQAQEAKRYAGLFGMCSPRIPLEKRLQVFEQTFRNCPWVNGMLVIVTWKSLQPTPDKFDWSETDRLVELAAKYNRKVSLLFVSLEAPEWIYKQGVEKFYFTDTNPHHQQSYGQQQAIPMPLSEKFYALWGSFIREAGRRYDSNPVVSAVVIMGVNFQGPETYVRMQTDPENIIAYWKKYIDLYMQAFPATLCTMHIAQMAPRDPSVLERVVAYGAENYSAHFQIQTDKLDGRKDQSGQPEYDLIRKYSSKIRVGFQTVASLKNKERQGSMLMTLMNGIRAGAIYYELPFGDINDPVISKEFSGLWQEGGKTGWEQLMQRAKESGEYKALGQDTYQRQFRQRQSR